MAVGDDRDPLAEQSFEPEILPSAANVVEATLPPDQLRENINQCPFTDRGGPSSIRILWASMQILRDSRAIRAVRQYSAHPCRTTTAPRHATRFPVSCSRPEPGMAAHSG